MGNCFSCFKDSQPAVTSTNESLEKDKEENLETDGMLQSSQERQFSPASLPEPQANGNSRSTGIAGFLISSNDSCGSLQREKTVRTFYNRLPPLTRSVTGSGDGKGKEVSEIKINTLFDQYKDPVEDNILAEGIERLCADLGVLPDDFKVLVLAWQLNAKQMCCFSRTEFVTGCQAMKVDSIRGMQSRLPDLVNDVNKDKDLFRDLYRFTFRFGLENGQRSLPPDMAISLWQLVFSVRTPPILSRWLNFLKVHPQIRGIPKDTWNMFLNFSEAVGDDLSSYDDNEAWPYLFDDFVECENDQMNQNVSKDKNGFIKQDCK